MSAVMGANMDMGRLPSGNSSVVVGPPNAVSAVVDVLRRPETKAQAPLATGGLIWFW